MNAMLSLSISLANPAGLALLGLAVPVILLHILKPRRESVTVSSTFLWRAIERPVSAASPWQKLRWSWLLVAQLLAVALLALAVAKPVRLENSTLSAHTVFIIDTSGSMAAVDGAPDRLSSAKQRAVELRKEMPTGGIASIVVASSQPRVVLTTSDDVDAFMYEWAADAFSFSMAASHRPYTWFADYIVGRFGPKRIVALGCGFGKSVLPLKRAAPQAEVIGVDLSAPLLRLAAALTGQTQAIDRLTGDLVIDASPIRAALGWCPPFSMERGLAETAAWYRAHRGGAGSRRR